MTMDNATTPRPALVILILMSCCAAVLGNSRAEKLLHEANRRIANIQTYDAIFTLRSETDGRETVSKYREVWRNEGQSLHYRVERLSPAKVPVGPYLYLRNQQGTWEVWSDRAFRIISEDNTEFHPHLAIKSNTGGFTVTESKLTDGTACYILSRREQAIGKGGAATLVEYWIGKADSLGYRITKRSRDGSISTAELQSVTVDEPIDESLLEVPNSLPMTTVSNRKEYFAHKLATAEPFTGKRRIGLVPRVALILLLCLGFGLPLVFRCWKGIWRRTVSLLA